MKLHRCNGFLLSFLFLAGLGLSGCTSRSTAQNQTDQDQQTREKVADATQKAKQESKQAAQDLEVAARQAEHDAKVAAQGVKEGWTRDHKGKLNLNSATEAELRGLPGLGEKQVQRVVNGRPYKEKAELMTRGILSEQEYHDIQDQVTVQWPPASFKNSE